MPSQPKQLSGLAPYPYQATSVRHALRKPKRRASKHVQSPENPGAGSLHLAVFPEAGTIDTLHHTVV